MHIRVIRSSVLAMKNAGLKSFEMKLTSRLWLHPVTRSSTNILPLPVRMHTSPLKKNKQIFTTHWHGMKLFFCCCYFTATLPPILGLPSTRGGKVAKLVSYIETNRRSLDFPSSSQAQAPSYKVKEFKQPTTRSVGHTRVCIMEEVCRVWVSWWIKKTEVRHLNHM